MFRLVGEKVIRVSGVGSFPVVRGDSRGLKTERRRCLSTRAY